MYGEKEEQVAELRLDLQDVTQLYKAQLDELVRLKQRVGRQRAHTGEASCEVTEPETRKASLAFREEATACEAIEISCRAGEASDEVRKTSRDAFESSFETGEALYEAEKSMTSCENNEASCKVKDMPHVSVEISYAMSENSQIPVTQAVTTVPHTSTSHAYNKGSQVPVQAFAGNCTPCLVTIGGCLVGSAEMT